MPFQPHSFTFKVDELGENRSRFTTGLDSSLPLKSRTTSEEKSDPAGENDRMIDEDVTFDTTEQEAAMIAF